MKVRNRFGGVHDYPEHIARALIKAGTVTAVDKPSAEPVTEPKPSARKAKKAEAE